MLIRTVKRVDNGSRGDGSPVSRTLRTPSVGGGDPIASYSVCL